MNRILPASKSRIKVARVLRGQKRPLKLKEIWSIRVRLQLFGRLRDLALVNLAIDSKLRGCDLLRLRVQDVCQSGRVVSRTILIQRKTGHPVQLEIMSQTREAVMSWMKNGGIDPGDYLFPGRIRVYAHNSRRP